MKTTNLKDGFVKTASFQDSFSKYVSLIQSIFTILGILTAVWFYINDRVRTEHANIDQKVGIYTLRENYLLIRLDFSVKNEGITLVKFHHPLGQLQFIDKNTVDPLSLKTAITDINQYSQSDYDYARFKIITSRIYDPEIQEKMHDRRRSDDFMSLEPGESQHVYFDFFVDCKTHNHLAVLDSSLHRANYKRIFGYEETQNFSTLSEIISLAKPCKDSKEIVSE